jgi:hypothetical protein
MDQYMQIGWLNGDGIGAIDVGRVEEEEEEDFDE